MSIDSKSTFFKRPGHITSRSEAYRKGLKVVKQSIGQFCGGKYLIKKVVEKKENMGTQSNIDYRSNHSSDRDRYRKDDDGSASFSTSRRAQDICRRLYKFR